MSNLLENDIRESLKEQEEKYWGRRMRDVIGKFGSSSPFDYLIFNGEQLCGIECKLLRSRKSGNPKSFPFSRLSDVQREGLQDLDSFPNGKGIILINFRWKKHKGDCYALGINEFLHLEEKLDRKSIPLEYFEENGFKIPRKDTGWDLDYLF